MHIAKYKARHITNLIKHYLREHITDNVDRERMKDNLAMLNEKIGDILSEEDGKTGKVLDFIFNEIKERVGRKIKSDQNVMLDLIITQPDYLGKEYNEEFFLKMVDALQNKYNYNGFNPFKKENMISAVIHNDEQGQPHMHYAFMPITPNSTRRQRHKQGKAYRNIDLDHERLCSDSFMHLDFLNSFHETMETLTGYTLTKSDNEKRDLTMKEYQNSQDIKRLKERIEKQDQEKETLKELNNKLDKENLQLIEKKKELKNDISELDKVIENKKEHIQQFERKLDNREILIPEIKEKKPTLTQPKNEIRFDRQQYEMQQQQLREFEKLIRDKAEQEKEKIKNEYDKLYQEREKTDFYKNWDNCEKKINNAYERYEKLSEEKDNTIISLSNKNRELRSTLENFETKKMDPLYEEISRLKTKCNNMIDGWKKAENKLEKLKEYVLDNFDISENTIKKVIGEVVKSVSNTLSR